MPHNSSVQKKPFHEKQLFKLVIFAHEAQITSLQKTKASSLLQLLTKTTRNTVFGLALYRNIYPDTKTKLERCNTFKDIFPRNNCMNEMH